MEAEELTVPEGYEAWASCYDDDGNPLIALEGPVVRGWLGSLDGLRALDLGCGTGRHTEAMADAGASVVAADLSAAMMAHARRKLDGRGVDWVRLALPPLPFASRSFHLCVMGLVAEHLADLAGTLAEVARVLEPDGHLILTALHPDRTAEGQRARFIDPRTGQRRPIATIHRTVAEYRDLGRGAGLALVEETPLVVPPGLATTHPRALRYQGMPLGWASRWRRPAG